MICETYTAGTFGCNAVLLGDKVSGQAIIVDPGDAVEETLARLKKHGLKAIAIVHTHAHVDHTMGSARLSELTGAPTYLHQGDAHLHSCMDVQALEMDIRLDVATPMDKSLKSGGCIHFGRYQLGGAYAGSYPGLCMFDGSGESLCLTGDTLV